MFEVAEIGRAVAAEEFKKRVGPLREDLLHAQLELGQSDFPVLLVFAGVDGAGKSEIVNLLNVWLDPRFLITRAFNEPSDEERERPEYWRYWQSLPPRGRIGLYLRSWYHRPILEHVYGDTDQEHFDRHLDRIRLFERALAEDGALILKFWLHLGKADQRRRLRALERNPDHHWRISKRDWKHYRMYDRFVTAAEHALHKTSTGHAPWTIIEGADENYRSLTVGTTVLEAIRRHIEQRAEAKAGNGKPRTLHVKGANGKSQPARETMLTRLDMNAKMGKAKYGRLLEEYQGRLFRLHQRAKQAKLSLVCLFEGWDAAGKGGTIRRITPALDAGDYQVIPIAAPTDEERARHYLWRFWRHLPRAGRVTIYDRSWYGRVLVERIEGFATEDAWRRAYSEITDFEEQLSEHGTVICKFWMHITQQEQLARFKAREKTGYKRHKLTDEDWRNREKWGLYETAVEDMVEHTSTYFAPWTLVESNDKEYARIRVLKTICDALKERLKKHQ